MTIDPVLLSLYNQVGSTMSMKPITLKDLRILTSQLEQLGKLPPCSIVVKKSRSVGMTEQFLTPPAW